VVSSSDIVLLYIAVSSQSVYQWSSKFCLQIMK
jgi:hypothetical protein